MPWPFGPSSSSEAPLPQKPRDNKAEGREPAKSWNSLLPKPDPPLQAAKEWAPVFLTAVGSLAAFMFYQSYLRRFAGAASIQENFFRKRSLLGRVTSVGDGDGFHLYHTPGGKLAGWGWLRKIPEGRSNLKGETVGVARSMSQGATDNSLDFHSSGRHRRARGTSFRTPWSALRCGGTSSSLKVHPPSPRTGSSP